MLMPLQKRCRQHEPRHNGAEERADSAGALRNPQELHLRQIAATMKRTRGGSPEMAQQRQRHQRHPRIHGPVVEGGYPV